MTNAAPIDDPADLTRYIETRYHALHRERLPKLTQLAEKVEAIHFGDEDAPDGLADVLGRMTGAMEVHMKKEELVLFPAMRKGGAAGIENPIAAMRADHDDRDRDIARIEEIARGFELPPTACKNWAQLYEGVSEFVEDLREHMRLENEVLFPRFEPQGAGRG